MASGNSGLMGSQAVGTVKPHFVRQLESALGHIRILLPAHSDFWGVQPEPQDVPVCINSCLLSALVGSAHFPTRCFLYFLFPLSLSPAPKARCS